MSSDLSRQARAGLKIRWIRTLGGVLATVLIFALAAPYILDVDRYRSRIADAISVQTGRQVSLGKIRLTILPSVGFSVDGFQMSNPPNFAQGQFALADQVQGSLDVWPLLLRRELRVVSLELIEPRLVLLDDGHGRNNYTFPPRRPATPPSSKPTPAAGSNSTAVSVMIDQVIMKDTVISYATVDRLGRQTATMHVANLDVELRQIVLLPLRIREWQADAQLGGAQLTLAGWNAPILFDSGNVALHDGKLESSFTLRFGHAARVDGAITLPDVENPVPQFDLKTADLDLGALLAGMTEPARARAESVGSWPLPIVGGRATVVATQTAAAVDRTMDPAADRLVAQGHIAAQRVRQGSAAAGPLTADLRIFQDRAEIWPFTLQLASGTVQVTARADRRQTPPRFSADVQVRGMQTEQLLEDSPALSMLTGPNRSPAMANS